MESLRQIFFWPVEIIGDGTDGRLKRERKGTESQHLSLSFGSASGTIKRHSSPGELNALQAISHSGSDSPGFPGSLKRMASYY